MRNLVLRYTKTVIRKMIWLDVYLCEMRYIQILAAVLKLLSRRNKQFVFVESSESLLTSRTLQPILHKPEVKYFNPSSPEVQ
jgi:hypothetical protein